VERAGLKPLRIHDLRHTAVALWIAAGASPKEIVMRAGHYSVSVVLDRYAHLFPGSETKVNDALDAMARGTQSRSGTVIPLQQMR
jgi:integrase